MGTGTIDINIVTGDLGFQNESYYFTDEELPCDTLETTSLYYGNYASLNTDDASGYSSSKYGKTRGTSIFTTQNQAVKWHLPASATSIRTSNFFAMPNIPNSYDGMNIQIGPGIRIQNMIYPYSQILRLLKSCCSSFSL